MILAQMVPDIIPEEKKPLEPPVEFEEFEQEDYFQLWEMITL